jgi:peptide/nickel transport system substrate-binding protein
MFKEGKISRREFLTRVSALGLMAAVSPALLATGSRAAAPKKGGRFVQGLAAGSTTDSMDPATMTDDGIYALSWQTRNNLVEIDHQGNAIPELAESWESSADASRWTFKIRKGVEFHNGKTIDAEDVVYSINHHRGEGSKSAAKGLLDPVKDIKADGKHDVIITLEGGNAGFPSILSEYHFTISPAGTQGKEWEKGIGTGGYMLQDWEPGVKASTKRNPNYWKRDRAHFDEIETIYIHDVNSRTNALKAAQIDFMSRCELKTARLLEKAPGLQLIRATGGFHFTMPMHTDVPPYNNNDVRLALKYAVDREQMVNTILRGYGAVANDHPIAPTYQYYASELPQRQFDPDKAKYHLKKAGMQGHVFELYASPHAGFDDQALLYKEHAAKAGINIEVVRKPADGYWSDVWLKVPFCMCHWNGRPTADIMFSLAYSGDAKWNDSHFRNARFDQLLKDARAELDDAKRREMYVECQRIVRDEGGVIVTMFKDNVDAAKDKVKFENVAGNYGCDGLRNAERWWFES